MILIVDLGIGNTGSLLNMFKKVNLASKLSTDPDEISKADRVVLPGVGSFNRGIERLDQSGVREALADFANNKGRPLLGICLGMQMLTRGSEEGAGTGLGLVQAETVRLRAPEGSRLRIPHMGWNRLTLSRSHPLFQRMPAEAKFYFVHSYHVVCDASESVLGETEYGYSFTSSVACGNVAGVQFHPEKSHQFGMRLLENFGRWS